MLAKVPNKDTKSVITALIRQARKLPEELYRSLTWDWAKLPPADCPVQRFSVTGNHGS